MALPVRQVYGGSPYSDAYKPIKSDVIELWQATLAKLGGANAGALIQTSGAALNTLTPAANTMAWVIGDPDPDVDGVYQYPGALPWVRRGPLPYGVIHLNNAGTGTADAIEVTTAFGLPDAAFSALYVLNVVEANTGPVTVSINGGTPKPVVNSTGSALDPGALQPGAGVLGLDDGTNIRLFLYGDVEALLAAAEAARDEAAASAAAAATFEPANFMDQATFNPTGVEGDAFDSGNQVFAQPETDARAWDLKSRGRQVVLLVDYYEPTDSDLTPAFQRWATQRTSINGHLLLPEGDVPFSGLVSLTDKHLGLVGKTMGQTRLLATHADAKFDFDYTGTSAARGDVKELHLEKFTFVKAVNTTAGNGGVAIEARWGNTGVQSSVPHAVVRDVDIAGDGADRFWDVALKLIDASNVYMSNPHLQNETTTDKSRAAIEIVRDVASAITSFQIDGGYIGRFANGILLTHRGATSGAGTVEGIYVDKTEFVSVQNIVADDNTDSQSYAVNGLHMSKTNGNSSRASIDVGRLDNLYLSANSWAHRDFNEVVVPAPLVACLRSVVGANVWNVDGNRFWRDDFVAADAPMVILPSAETISRLVFDQNSCETWTAALHQAGTQSTTKDDLYWGGGNVLFGGTVLSDTGCGYRPKVGSAVGSYANGAVINYGQTFASVPNIHVTSRESVAGTAVSYSAATTTGFTIHHNGAGTRPITWQAVET